MCGALDVSGVYVCAGCMCVECKCVHICSVLRLCAIWCVEERFVCLQVLCVQDKQAGMVGHTQAKTVLTLHPRGSLTPAPWRTIGEQQSLQLN